MPALLACCLAAVLLPLAAFAADPASPAFADQMAFDYADERSDLPGWSLSPGTDAMRDRERPHAGTASARIVRDAGSAQEFSALMYAIDRQYVGERIELRGYLRTADVEGWSGFWLGLNDGQDSREYANMAQQQLDGTREWQRYSIDVPLNPDATRIVFGVLLQGTGTIWADDLELLVDGAPIATAPTVIGPLDADTEFDAGSGIEFDALGETQVANLALLGRVWGFLKFHHPAVTGGGHHWDYELFRVMGPVLAAAGPGELHAVLRDWVARLGPVADCSDCAPEPAGTHLLPRLDWLRDTQLLGEELSEVLLAVHRNRRNATDLYFVRPNGGVGNAVFPHEPDYADRELPDDGYRQLAVFRFWNVVEYWFPYRNVIDTRWDDVLPAFIGRMAAVSTVEDYHRTLTLLIAAVDDTHAKWNVTRSLPPVGECRLPVALRHLDDDFVVWKHARKGGDYDGGLRAGDVVLEIDGRSLPAMADELAAYYPASNRAARLRDMGTAFSRGACGAVDVVVQRGERRRTVRDTRVPDEQFDRERMYQHVRAGEVYQQLSADVAYIKLPGIESSRIPGYLERLQGTKGLVVDIRGYPSDFVVFALGQHLVGIETPFVRFTQADMKNPGAFTWSRALTIKPREPRYDGRVVVLVDEWTQSSAEYTALALRAAGARVVGSTTAGADGNYSPLNMPGGVHGGITGLGVFYPDQRPTQRLGIVPDVAARPTAAGIRAGRDEVLEAGIRALAIDGIDAHALRAMAMRGRRDAQGDAVR